MEIFMHQSKPLPWQGIVQILNGLVPNNASAGTLQETEGDLAMSRDRKQPSAGYST